MPQAAARTVKILLPMMPLNLLLQAIDSSIVANNASSQDLKERLEGGTLKERHAVTY